MTTTGSEVNDLIHHLSRVAHGLDPDVYETAMDTSLTERPELIAHYDARQRLARRLVRVAHELNSILPDRRLTDEIASDAQPSEYGRSHDGMA